MGGTFISTILILIYRHSLPIIRIQKLFLVSIALLLIPRNNQLDQLFKTAAASLSSIGNLLLTWAVLFLVFAIALTQSFGLTKFGGNENTNLNFRTVPKALIVLFRCSVGEGWNEIMEDMASMSPPFCTTERVENTYSSDCGSTAWARFLFIAWNILSMYIFVNLFVSLIYESFSYVYQSTSGLSVISREEIRRFKEAWAVVDPQGSGYIQKDDLRKLLRELSGVFEMRIYDGDYTVERILSDCTIDSNEGIRHASTSLPIEHLEAPRSREIDLEKLNRRLQGLPVKDIQRRRERLNEFYEEVLISADKEKGISFNILLMILAHYKVIDDNKSLQLKEYLKRRERLRLVHEQVHRNFVIGFFNTLFRRRPRRNPPNG